jgi:hypothetical protein
MCVWGCDLYIFKKLCLFCYSQLAEQYGANIATEIVARSRSNLRLNTMPYAALTSTTSPVGRHMKYNSLSTHPPNET